MRKKRFVFCVLLFSILGLPQIYAQETTNSAGGKATGTGGTASYSVGQTLYSASSSESGSIIEGVQQPYEVFITTGLDVTTINLDLKVFPNPIVTELNLEIDKVENDLSYQLYNIDGKLLKSNDIYSKKTQIEMSEFQPSTYLLSVIKKEQVIKSFKIIKY